MLLGTLLEGVNIIRTNVELNTQITQVASDSRGILKGGLFVCIKGTRTDGHRYIYDALRRGATAVVAEDTSCVPEGVPYIIVENTRLAESYIWDNWYEHPARGMKTVAVTGTNGKTSTVFILESIIASAGKRCGIITTVCAKACGKRIGTYGGSSVTDRDSAMTTPDPEYFFGTLYAMKRLGVEYAVYEATSHALALHKTDPVKPDVAVFTNLTEEHLDFHGTQENYFLSKARLGELAQTIVVNIDDPYMARLASEYRKSTVSCSAARGAKHHTAPDVTALRVDTKGTGGVSYIYFSREAVFNVICPIPGEFTVYNSMLAAAAALKLGISPEAVKSGIGSITGIPGRLERVECMADFEVYIDFAHTPDALRGLLESVRSRRRSGSKIILLFGCGGDRDRSKRRKMGAVASSLADFTVITSDNCRGEDPDEIIAEIMNGIDRERPHAVISDRREAIKYAVSIAEAGDILLLAGKGHEKYEITSAGMTPFDEAALVREAVGANFGRE